MGDKLESYTKLTKAWFKDAEEGYIVGTMSHKTVDSKQVSLTFTMDTSGKVCTSLNSIIGISWLFIARYSISLTPQEHVYSQTILKLEACAYEDLPPLKNPPRLEGADDLTSLSYLHEYQV